MIATNCGAPAFPPGGRRLARAGLLAIAIAIAIASPLALAHGDLHDQIVAISQRIQADPSSVDLVIRRAELYREHEQWPEAAADYYRAEVLDRGRAAINLGRGKMFLATGKLGAARTQLDTVLKAQPHHVDALVTRAQVLQAQGKHLAAAADYAQAIATASEPEPDFYLGRANALSQSSTARTNDAIACLDEGIARLGKLPTLSLAAIELELGQGAFDSALARLDTLREGQPRQEGWLERRGDILSAAQRPELAMQAWRDALAALDALPPRLRGTGAMLQLRNRLSQRLQTGRPRPP